MVEIRACFEFAALGLSDSEPVIFSPASLAVGTPTPLSPREKIPRPESKIPSAAKFKQALKRHIATLIAVASVFAASAQQRTILEGLERNAEYRELIEQERGLVKTADSLSTEISSLRGRLRADTLGRAANSAAIVRMEGEGFEIRSRMARLASRINTIEQEWILRSLAQGPVADILPHTDAAPKEDAPHGYHTRNLVYGTYFSDALSPGQLAELHDAQRVEERLPMLFARYREDHETLGALAAEYERATLPADADSLGRMFREFAVETEATEERIGDEWGAIFDSKSYIYNLLADKQNRRDLLDSFERGMERTREERSRYGNVPAPLVDYVLQKRMLAAYELSLAEDMDNRLAVDSLRRAAAEIPEPALLAGLAPVVLKERLFLDYSDVAVGGSPYNSSNPIPEVAVWPKGVIWRVMVGNFASRQSPSVFRGAHPMAVQTGDDKRFRYFAGGFPTDSLANTAVERLRKAGFRAPSAVVWMDGVYIDPASADEKAYRIEISGVEELSPEVREIIASATKDSGPAPEATPTASNVPADAAPQGVKAGIVRAAGAFLVTPLDGPSAVRLRTGLESLRAAHPEMEVRLSKNPE